MFRMREISIDEAKEFDLATVDARYIMGATSSRRWAVDDDADTRLRQVCHRVRADEPSKRVIWNLYIAGDVLEIATDLLKYEIGAVENTIDYKIVEIKSLASRAIERERLLKVFHEALSAYGNGGLPPIYRPARVGLHSDER